MSLLMWMFACIQISYSEWVQVSPVFRNSSLKPEVIYRGGMVKSNSLYIQEEAPCPDIHNLTMMMWYQEDRQRELPIEDSDGFFGSNYPKDSEGKFAFLTSLRENLERNIEFEIESFGKSRSARGKLLPDIPREAALVSISLLLFAVYLIKLVMKVIEKIQEKKKYHHSNMSTMNVKVPVSGRRKRELPDMETVHIMLAIDKYASFYP